MSQSAPPTNHDLVVKLFDDIVNGKDDLQIQESNSESVRDARKSLLDIFPQWRDTHDDQLFDKVFRDTAVRYLQDDLLARPLPNADRSEWRACQLAGVIKQFVIAPREAVHIKEIEVLRQDILEYNSKLLDLKQAGKESRAICDAKQNALEEQTNANAILAIEARDQAKKLSDIELKSQQYQEDNRTLVRDLGCASKTNEKLKHEVQQLREALHVSEQNAETSKMEHERSEERAQKLLQSSTDDLNCCDTKLAGAKQECIQLQTPADQVEPLRNELSDRNQQLADMKSELERKEVVISYLESRLSKHSTDVGSNGTARRVSAPELRGSTIEHSEEDSRMMDIAPPQTDHQSTMPTSKGLGPRAASINGNGKRNELSLPPTARPAKRHQMSLARSDDRVHESPFTDISRSSQNSDDVIFVGESRQFALEDDPVRAPKRRRLSGSVASSVLTISSGLDSNACLAVPSATTSAQSDKGTHSSTPDCASEHEDTDKGVDSIWQKTRIGRAAQHTQPLMYAHEIAPWMKPVFTKLLQTLRQVKKQTHYRWPKAMLDGRNCLGVMINFKSLWTRNEPGTFACFTCVRQKRVCFRWDASEEAFVALPLPPELQKGAGPAQERHFHLSEDEHLRPMPPLWIKTQELHEEARQNSRRGARPRRVLPTADPEE